MQRANKNVTRRSSEMTQSATALCFSRAAEKRHQSRKKYMAGIPKHIEDCNHEKPYRARGQLSKYPLLYLPCALVRWHRRGIMTPSTAIDFHKGGTAEVALL